MIKSFQLLLIEQLKYGQFNYFHNKRVFNNKIIIIKILLLLLLIFN